MLAAPWLFGWLDRVYVLSPGSRLRCAVIGRGIRVGVAANNRRDYQAVAVALSPDVELDIYPDSPEVRPVGLEPTYYGREAYVNGVEELKASLGSFRWELRELVDPGGHRFGARAERIGTGDHSGIEVRDTDFHVWQTERGLVRRQWALSSEEAMMTLLERGSHVASAFG